MIGWTSWIGAIAAPANPHSAVDSITALRATPARLDADHQRGLAVLRDRAHRSAERRMVSTT